MFKYKADKVPDISLSNSWPLKDGGECQLYRAGNWSFELPDDGNLVSVEEAIYAWIAWYDFLTTSKEIGQ